MPYTDPNMRRAYFRQRYATDDIFKQKALARAKKRRTLSRTAINEYKREWRKRPGVRERERIAFRKYQRTHRNYFTDAGHRYRARVRATKVEKIDLDRIILESHGICGICNTSVIDSKIDFDHIIPISRGGTHTYDNLQVTHASCNKRKWAKIIPASELGRR